MPDYVVRVSYEYPVSAISPKDAMDTVPMVIKGRFIGFLGKGITEILNTEGEVVLKAKLVTKPRGKGGLYGQKSKVRQVPNKVDYPDKGPDPASGA